MKRQVTIGGVVIVISVATAAAYGIVQSRWFSSTAPQSAGPGGTTTVATPQASAVQGSPGERASGPMRQPVTVAQAPAPQTQPAAPPQAAAKAAIPCENPNAMGVARVVEIDTAGGPGFGSQHFKTYDFLRDHEVVLTFDDGPWLNNTQAVLKALADQCLRATFFPIGKHATYYPEILRQVAAAGHTIGSHTWSHADLQAVVQKNPQEAVDEIEKGLSAVHWALQGTPHAPFFRFPALRHPPEMVTYLGKRNIGIFSCDFDSFDFKIHKPEQVVSSVMSKLAKHGKGIILMHDFQKATSMAVPTILAQLKAGGYKIVHMVPKDNATTLAQYDELIPKEVPGGLQTVNSRPVSSVIRTIEGQ